LIVLRIGVGLHKFAECDVSFICRSAIDRILCKSKRKRWTESLGHMARIELPTVFIWGNVEERDSLENQSLGEKISLHERCDRIHLVLDKDKLLYIQ